MLYLSIKSRLTLFIIALIFLLTISIGLSISTTLFYILNQSENNFSRSELNYIHYFFTQNNVHALKQEISDIPGITQESPYLYYIRLYNIDTKELLATQKIENILPITLSENKQFWPKYDLKRFVKNKKRYLLLKSYIQNGQETWLMEIILDISYKNYLIESLKKNIVLILIVFVCLSIVISQLIIKRIIKNIFTLAESAKKISSHSLHERIPSHSWPEELKLLGSHFNQMLDRIENSFIKLKQFSADLAHEIRTPIHNLMGETEVALLTRCSEKDFRNLLESNLEELTRLSHIIENILFLASIESPELKLTTSFINIHHEIETLLTFYESLLEEKGIKVTLEGEAGLVANQIMFSRILANLIENAIKYTPHDGRISFYIKQNSSFVDIIIEDTGIGIPSHALEHIFDRFYRVDRPNLSDLAGTGLGLAIVKSTVELHHGQIKVESKENYGTTVRLSFKILD